MLCRACNNPNDADATFCVFCGTSFNSAAVPVMSASATSVVAAPPAVKYEPAMTVAPPAHSGTGNLSITSAPADETEALTYDRFVESLCRGQGFLTSLVIRFYYVTGLKSYLVTHHDSFVVPNLRRGAGEICANIKSGMDALGYQELLTTFLYMKTEHIQTLSYLSRSMIRDEAGTSHNLQFFGSALGFIRLALEVVFGVFFVIADGIKYLFRALSHQAGLGVQTVGRTGEDELRTGTRLLLASTYRHTRTYTYVRDVGPETYVGWFTHHEPPPSMVALIIAALVLLIVGLTGAAAGLPFVFLLGVAGGIGYTLWLAPLILSRLGALPKPRYISALIFLLNVPIALLGIGLLDTISSPEYWLYGRRGYGMYGMNDPFMVMMAVAAYAAWQMLVVSALIAFVSALMRNVTHFDQFDAETHSQIIKERIGLILAEHLESSGYNPTEIADILSRQSPGAGRYRRARA
jgi:hypothetical protein